MKKTILLSAALLLTVCLYGQRSVRIYNKGNKILHEGNYEKAIKLFSMAIKLDRIFPEAYYNRAIAKSELKNYREAIQDYSKAIDLDPKFAGAYNNRGVNKNELGDYAGAID